MARRISRLFSMVAIVAMFAASDFASAAVSAPKDPAARAEWNRLVAAAKKEGVVAVGGLRGAAGRAFLLRKWKEDFPDVLMQFTVGGGFKWPNRVKAERANGKFLWDIYLNGPNVLIYRMAGDGVFEKLEPYLFLPELKQRKTWRRDMADLFIDKDRRMMSLFSYPSTIWYNAKKVSPAEVAEKGVNILLDPKYKGRIAWQDPRIGGPGSNFAAWLYVQMGKDALKKIVVDQDSQFYARATQATEALVRGKADIVLALRLSELEKYRKAGMNLDIRPFGATGKTSYLAIGGAMLAVFNRAAHPAAAKLLANWVLTREVQEGFARATKLNSNRSDVAPTAYGGLSYDPSETYVETQKQAMLGRKVAAQKFIRSLRPQ